jgi:hypothetical protein
LLENWPTVLKTEEDSRSQQLKEQKSQGEVDLNRDDNCLREVTPTENRASRGPEVAAPSLDYSATDRYSAEELLILLINFMK